MNKKIIKNTIIAFTFIILMFTTMINVKGAQTGIIKMRHDASQYGNYNGQTKFHLQYTDDPQRIIFCTKFKLTAPSALLNSETGERVEQTCTSTTWVENNETENKAISAAVGYIVNKALNDNTDFNTMYYSMNRQYYFAVLSINQLLFDVTGDTDNLAVDGWKNYPFRILMDASKTTEAEKYYYYYHYYLPAKDIYENMKEDISINLSRTSGNWKYNLAATDTTTNEKTNIYKIGSTSADEYIVTAQKTKGDANVTITITDTNGNAKTKFKGGESFKVKVSGLQNIQAGASKTEVTINVEGTRKYNASTNYKCGEGYQSVTDSNTQEKTESKSTFTYMVFTRDELPDYPDLRIVKEDFSGKSISSANFEIKKNNQTYDNVTTSQDGTIVIEDLEEGNYCIQEKKAPNGYILDNTNVCFDVSINNNNVIVTPTSQQTANNYTFNYNTETNFITYTLKNDKNIVRFKKVDENGNLLKGAKLRLLRITTTANATFETTEARDVDGNIIEPWITTNEEYEIHGLPDGRYILREEEAPDGYISGQFITFSKLGDWIAPSTKEGSIPIITITNEQTKVNIRKVDITGSSNLSGAKFQIKDRNGNKVKYKRVNNVLQVDPTGTIDTWSTTTSDQTIKGLNVGEIYTLSETQAPTGYKKIGDIKFIISETGEVRITEGQTSATASLTDVKVTNEKSSFTVKKVDIGNPEVSLKGAELQILTEAGNENTAIKIIVTNDRVITPNENGDDSWQTTTAGDFTIKGLPVGRTYYIHEKTAPTGYSKNRNDISVTIESDGTIKVNGNVENSSIATISNTKTNFQVAKIDEKTGNKISGAELQILQENPDTNKKNIVGISVDNTHHKITYPGGQTYWKTDANNDFTIEGLPVGTYYIHEVKAPDGYTKSTKDIKVTINEFGDILVDDTASDDSVVVVKNTKTVFKVTKTDEKTGKLVKGAQLQILDNKGKIVGINVDKDKNKITYPGGNSYWETSEESAFEIEGLPVGSYEIKEIKAPKGYVLSNETIKFTVNEDGTISVNGKEQDSATLIMSNVNTKVYISKQDITTSKELPGAHLVVKDEKGNIVKDGEWDSTTEPHLIEGLGEGTYTITEITSPDGYTKSEETVTFTIDANGALSGNTIMYNTPIPDVPNTLSTQSLIITIVGLIIIGTGIGLYIYGLRKKKDQI